MKSSFPIFLLVFLSEFTSAQQVASNDNLHQTAFKFAPAGLAVGKITVGGEYNFKYRNSITLVAGIPFDQKQPVTYDGNKSDIHSKAFSMMGGYRYYLGKKSMSGLYIEPYLKYLKQESKGFINADLNDQHVIFDSHSTYEGIGIGAQLGVQCIIARFLVLDFFLIGPEANSSRFSSLSTDITNNLAWSFADGAEAEKDIRNVLKDIPVVGDKVDVKVDTNKKTVSTGFSGFAPGLRIGGSIGIRF